MKEVLNSINRIGFKLLQVENEAAPYRLRKRLPFIQEFEFYPTSGPFRGRLKELEIVFYSIGEHDIEMIMEIDRRARGLSGFLAEALDLDESYVRVRVSRQDVPNLDSKLINIIRQYS